jgi:hypothetical protein
MISSDISLIVFAALWTILIIITLVKGFSYGANNYLIYILLGGILLTILFVNMLIVNVQETDDDLNRRLKRVEALLPMSNP